MCISTALFCQSFTSALGFVVCLSIFRKETLAYLIICKPLVSKSSYVAKVTELGNCISIQWVHSSEAATRGVLYKKGVFKNFWIFTGKHLCWSLLLIKLQALRPAAVLKRDSTTCEYCEILKNTFFEEHQRTAISDSWKPPVISRNCDPKYISNMTPFKFET